MEKIFYIGAKGQLIMQLQQFLNCKGWHIAMDGIFGSGTQHALGEYLIKSEGACVDLLSIIASPSNLDKWCLSIKDMEGYIEPNAKYSNGTSSWRNNNPGNLEFRGQRNAVQNGRWAKFNTYQDGYNALKSLLIRACTGQMSLYSPGMSLEQFYGVYAPSTDDNNPVQYANKVAKDLGVDPSSTPIKDLLP